MQRHQFESPEWSTAGWSEWEAAVHSATEPSGRLESGQHIGVDTKRIGLARGVDIADPQHIRILESRRPGIEQRSRARVGVRLEVDNQPPIAIARPRGGQCRAHLRRVMGVVVDDGHAITGFDLEAAIHPTEIFERSGDDIRVNFSKPHLARSGKRCRRVQYVVQARYVQLQFLCPGAIEAQRGRRTQSFKMNIGDAHIGSRSGAVRDDAPFDLRCMRRKRRIRALAGRVIM